MMRLSTMWRVDRTIDAEGSSPVAEALLAAWPHEPGSIRFFRSSANFLYTFSHAGARYFLRFVDEADRSRAEVDAEMAIVRWLDAHGVSVALPVRSRGGAWVETAETTWGTFHAVVFSALDGDQRDSNTLDLAGFWAWGEALGRLHAVSRACPIEIVFQRPTLGDRLRDAATEFAHCSPAVRHEYGRVVAALDGLPVGPERVGLLHGDFELDNLLWGDGVSILDFDGCMIGWYAADIAFALRDLFDAGAGRAHRDVGAFIAGYRSHAPLAEADLRLVPLFSRVARLLIYASVVRALELEEGDEDPDWLRGLGAALRGRVSSFEQLLAQADGPSIPS